VNWAEFSSMLADLPDIEPEFILAMLPLGAAGLVIVVFIVIAIIRMNGES
jgi:hypothetical protein